MSLAGYTVYTRQGLFACFAGMPRIPPTLVGVSGEPIKDIKFKRICNASFSFPDKIRMVIPVNMKFR